ncbi:dihydrodipicolinate synthase family protein [Paracoccus benzoatiresistens]|uniref:Dihydrodipicolinate synthase family protein n=1 Tax=Paracoccus benzoatiresistens TaxID=2997341 RepID=A0ABT4J9H3_9RHOB|nr:dihydrodipicolinate synthase family protein [Paracoccus sp. EF6]MCZ0963350.1 dihydrodipicolinate synthase family protein [Paracoccus sp. EF6]
MKTHVSLDDLAASVIAVPPLAATAHLQADAQANGALIRHIEAGGVSTLLYGGNANVQNWPVSRYGEWLDLLAGQVAAETWLIPSVGPDGGKAADQAALLAARNYPAAMFLPFTGPRTDQGLARGIRDFVQASGTQAILYIKSDGYLAIDSIEELVADGSLFSVKYAIPRADAADDPVLDDLIAAIGAERIVSGFGEPPALPHLRHKGLAGFTAGCVCIAPTISQSFLRALKAGSFAEAEQILASFAPLEELRDRGDPIRVLHTAVSLSGIADMGPTLPFLTPADETLRSRIEAAARDLLAAEMAARRA